jgi:hypothetical protein
LPSGAGSACEADPQARMLVVLPGAAGLRERLATLLRQSLAPRAWVAGEDAGTDSLVAIEGGESLARAPLVAHALTALAVICGATPFETLSAWLCAPYWRQPDAAARARVDDWLRSSAPLWSLTCRRCSRFWQGSRPAPRGKRQCRARAAHAPQLPQRCRCRRTGGTPREWAERIRAALEALGWPGDAARTSAAEQTVQRFNELLNEFGELAVPCAPSAAIRPCRSSTNLPRAPPSGPLGRCARHDHALPRGSDHALRGDLGRRPGCGLLAAAGAHESVSAGGGAARGGHSRPRAPRDARLKPARSCSPGAPRRMILSSACRARGGPRAPAKPAPQGVVECCGARGAACPVAACADAPRRRA